MSNRPGRIAALVLRLLLALLFIAAGLAKLAAIEFEREAFAHFGYAPWFMYLIGALELAGGVLLLLPAWAPLGAALMLPVMLGAAWSHWAANDGPAMMAAPLVILLLLLVPAWPALGRLRGAPQPA